MAKRARNGAQPGKKAPLVTKARRWAIAESVARLVSRAASLKDIYAEFGQHPDFGRVSQQTIRNDLRAIASLPKLDRDPATSGLRERPNEMMSLVRETFFERSLGTAADEKAAMAEALVNPAGATPVTDREGKPLIDCSSGSLVVGPGSTVLPLLEFLASSGPQIMTCNIGVLLNPLLMTPSVHLCGGWLHRDTGCLLGSEAAKEIAQFKADTAIIGLSGLHWEPNGPDGIGDIVLSCHFDLQREVKRALITNRRKIIVVTCGQAIDRTDAWEFARVSQILRDADLYIVTNHLPSSVEGRLRESFERLSVGREHTAVLVALDKEQT